MADAVVVHKAEEERLAACRTTAGAYRQALRLPQPPSGSDTEVMLVSGLTGDGHDTLGSTFNTSRKPGRTRMVEDSAHPATA